MVHLQDLHALKTGLWSVTQWMLRAWKTWLQIICLTLCGKDRKENYISKNLSETLGMQVPSCIPAVLGLILGVKESCAGGTSERQLIIQLKSSADSRINMTKNGISGVQ